MATDFARMESNQLTEMVIGAAIEVHKEMGAGYLEAAYEAALCHELKLRNIPFERQFTFNLMYKGEPVGEGRLDIFVAKRLIIELKSTDQLLPIHHAQVISYLKSMKVQLALLINFNVRLLRDGIRRIILD